MAANASPFDARLAVYVDEFEGGSAVRTSERPRQFPEVRMAGKSLNAEAAGPNGWPAGAVGEGFIQLVDGFFEELAFALGEAEIVS